MTIKYPNHIEAILRPILRRDLLFAQDKIGNLRNVLSLPADKHDSRAQKNFLQHFLGRKSRIATIDSNRELLSQRCDCFDRSLAALTLDRFGRIQRLRLGERWVLEVAICRSQ